MTGLILICPSHTFCVVLAHEMLDRIVDMASRRENTTVTPQLRSQIRAMLRPLKDMRLFSSKSSPAVQAQYEAVARDLVALLNSNISNGHYLPLQPVARVDETPNRLEEEVVVTDGAPNARMRSRASPSTVTTTTATATATTVSSKWHSISSLLAPSRSSPSKPAVTSTSHTPPAVNESSTSVAVPAGDQTRSSLKETPATPSSTPTERKDEEDEAQEILEGAMNPMALVMRDKFIPLYSDASDAPPHSNDDSRPTDQDGRYYKQQATLDTYQRLVTASPKDVSLWLGYALEVRTH